VNGPELSGQVAGTSWPDRWAATDQNDPIEVAVALMEGGPEAVSWLVRHPDQISTGQGIQGLVWSPHLAAADIQAIYNLTVERRSYLHAVDDDIEATQLHLLCRRDCPAEVAISALITNEYSESVFNRVVAAVLDNPAHRWLHSIIWNLPNNHRVWKFLARRPDLPVASARRLLASQPLFPPPQLGCNPVCPQDVLMSLAQHREAATRRSVASNPSCPPEILQRLLGDPDLDVATTAAMNPSLPRAALAMWQLTQR